MTTQTVQPLEATALSTTLAGHGVTGNDELLGLGGRDEPASRHLLKFLELRVAIVELLHHLWLIGFGVGGADCKNVLENDQTEGEGDGLISEQQNKELRKRSGLQRLL